VRDDEGFRKKLRHDLRSPLSVVLGRAEILLSELHGPLSPEQRRSVEDIVRHALRMNVELTALAEQYDDLRGRGDPG
jgi:signal transduction histidine kinase